MRVLMTTDTVGGVWTFTQELSAHLLPLGCSVHLVSLGRLPRPWQKEWAEQMQNTWPDEFFYEALDVPLEWMQENDRAYDAAVVLEQRARDYRADIFHSNQFCFGDLPLTIPKVVTAHSDVMSWSRAVKGQAPACSPWLDRYKSLVSEGIRKADAVTAPGPWMAQSVQRDFALTKTPVVIANGRSVPEAPPSQRRMQAVTSGRLWDEAKNIGILADVQAPFPLFIAGDACLGDSADQKRPGSATMLGALSQDALFRLFRESSVYICTSVYEPFGLAPLEAALCGCAVLANDIPSLREVWHDGALYFQNAANLTSTLCDLFTDPGHLRSAQARSHARAHLFRAEQMAAAYHQLFGRLIAGEGIA